MVPFLVLFIKRKKGEGEEKKNEKEAGERDMQRRV